MTALDIFVILLLGGAALIGFVRGFTHEVLSLLANLATDMVYGGDADRPEWMTESKTYTLLNATGRAVVDWVEARRRPEGNP